MQKPIVVTSIPPAAHRVREGRDYLLSTRPSWEAAGFCPVSVNSAQEATDAECETVVVDDDASRVIGRPHVWFCDLLRAAIRRCAGRPFAITNADIRLSAGGLGDAVSGLKAGTFLIARRVDVDAARNETGTPYYHGFDFFAVHPDDVSGVLTTGMIFGAPWWDHFLPVTLLLRGVSGKQLCDPIAFHTRHADRWDDDAWAKLGKQFLADIRPTSHGAYARRIAIAKWKRSRRYRPLNYVSAVNISFIDAETR